MDIYSDRISIDQARTGTAALLGRRHHPPARPHRHQPLGRPGHAAPRLRRRHAADAGALRPGARRAPPRRPARPRRPPPDTPARPARRQTLRGPTRRPGRHPAAAPSQRGDPSSDRRPRPADGADAGSASSSCSRTCSDAARQLHRSAPLRRRHHPAPTQRRPRTVRAAPARPRHRPRRLALPLPHHQPATRTVVVREVRPGGAPPARQALPRRLPRALPPLQPTWLLRMDLLPQRRRTPPAARPRRHRPRARFKPRDVFDYGRALHDIQLNAWVLAYRRLLGSALLDWHGEHQLTPPRTARQAQLRLDDDWSVEGLRDPQPRPVVPDAALEIADDASGEPAALPDRVRPHQPHRQELRQVPPLRRLPHLVVAPHPPRRPWRRALRPVRLPGRCPARRLPRAAPTTSSPATSGTPRTPPISTNTSGAAESSSATNATSTWPSCHARQTAALIRPGTPRDGATMPTCGGYDSPAVRPAGTSARCHAERETWLPPWTLAI